ncbi:DNA-binding protein [Candidatus Microgenomates bacterium]|jgi:DNA-binding protein HU-beta|nr:MAG: DNA-binding protein [Candidatus Microgenomates bacterium]
MKKIDLIEIVADKAHLTRKASKESIETFLSEVEKALSKGEKVVISGFGTFKSVLVKDKAVINPQTKQKQVVKSHRVARFTPGRSLKKSVK